MQSLKPGRGPSAMGAAVSVVMILFGILWTVLVFLFTQVIAAVISHFVPIPLVHVVALIFPAFGLLFIAVAVISLIYNLYNTVGRNRLSTFEIASDQQEIDPLDRRFGPAAAQHTGARAFCPFCGEGINDQFEFCPKCGKKL